MAPKPSELLAARAELEKVQDLGDPASFIRFEHAITGLLKIVSGDSAQIEKDLANKLLRNCRCKLVSQANLALEKFDSYPAESLEAWDKLIETVLRCGFADDPELNALKEQFLARRDLQTANDLNPVKLQVLEKELRAALDILSVHRRQLANLSIRKP